MRISRSIQIKSPSEHIFNLYENTDSWPIWDPELSSVNLPTGLILGAKGSLKPKKGPKASIEITELTRGKSFTVSSKLPFCRMLFKHELIEVNEETTVKHTVIFLGPLNFLFYYLIRKSMRGSLPNTLTSLKNFIEAK